MNVLKKFVFLFSFLILIGCDQTSKEELPSGETFNEVSNTVETFTYSSRSVHFLVNTSNVFIRPNKSFDGHTFSTSPTLPDGISIDTVTGVISGTPSVPFTKTDFIVEARGFTESQFANIEVSIGEEPPLSIKYQYSTLSFVKKSLGTYALHEETGGAASSFTITPPLPSGLTLDTSGTIAGAPDNASSGIYTVTAINSSGTTKTSFFITVTDTMPQLTGYSNDSQTLNILNPFSTMVPTITDTPAQPKPDNISYSIFPQLPEGLVLNSDGTISGTPLKTIGVSSFKVSAYNDIGTTTFDITINLTDVPRQLTYPQASYNIQQGISIPNINVSSYEGITPVTYSLDGSEPTGITINSLTGLISGTTTVGVGIFPTIVRATHIPTGNITSTLVTFNLSEDIPESSTNMGYLGSYQLYEDQIFNITPSVAGGSPSSYTINPNLGTTIPGLSFNTTTGTISGTPTAAISETNFNIIGYNLDENNISVQTVSQNVALTVSTLPPIMLGYLPTVSSFYEPSTNIFELEYNNGASIDIFPNITSGGIPVTYSISPSLPGGLSFNIFTGTITGTPTEINPVEYYTITGTNPAGSYSETIALSVSDPTFVASASTGGILLRQKAQTLNIINSDKEFSHKDNTTDQGQVPFEILNFDFNLDGFNDLLIRNKDCDGENAKVCPDYHSSTSIYLQAKNEAGSFSKTLQVLPPHTKLNAIAVLPIRYAQEKAGLIYVNNHNANLQTRSTTNIEFNSTPLHTKGYVHSITSSTNEINSSFSILTQVGSDFYLDQYKINGESLNNISFVKSTKTNQANKFEGSKLVDGDAIEFKKEFKGEGENEEFQISCEGNQLQAKEISINYTCSISSIE